MDINKLIHEKKDRVIIQKINDSEAGGLTSVKNDEFFHGYIPTKQTPKLLIKKGDFLVRQPVKAETKNTSQEQFVISIRMGESVYVHKDHEDWYHKWVLQGKPGGDLGRLVMEATILEMDEKTADNYQLVEEGVNHYHIKYSRRARLYYINGYGFTYVSGLIDYHRRKKISVSSTDEEAQLLKPIKRAEWQYNHEQIHRKKKLGDGAFGDVFLGTLRLGLISTKKVAVKTINGTITAEENEKLFEEAMLMQRMTHDNIVRLYGVASNEDPVMIVMELASGGSVLDAVRKKSPTIAQKINYVYGAAKGLKYLQDKRIVHRDLAARNTLIGKHDQAKISDFGLSITGGQKKEKKLKKVPTRYLAPQTLRNAVYDLSTDMWTFGIYIWEVFHNGPSEPYSFIENNTDVRTFVIEGKRLGVQAGMEYPTFLWDVTKRCWMSSRQERINVDDLVDVISAEDNKYNGNWFRRHFLKQWVDVELSPTVADGWMTTDVELANEEDKQWKAEAKKLAAQNKVSKKK